jgi:TolB protein
MNLKTIIILGIAGFILNGCASSNTGKALPSVPGTTSNAESLVRETSDPSIERYPSVSPDGRFLLYNAIEDTRTAGTNTSGQSVIRTDRRSIIVKKEIGKPTKSPLLQNASDPVWMPNGNVMCTYTKPSKPVIIRTSSEGVGLNYVSQGEMGEDDAEPAVSNDGSKIFFTTIIGNSRMVCSMDIKGGNYTVITEGGHVRVNPRDNTKIIYNLRVGNFVQLFTMDMKSGQKTQVTSGDNNNRDGAYSLDGKYIAYSSNRENPKGRNYHIYVMSSDGTGINQLTQGSTDEGDPCWSPDGWVYFYSNAERNYNIWKVKPRL